MCLIADQVSHVVGLFRKRLQRGVAFALNFAQIIAINLKPQPRDECWAVRDTTQQVSQSFVRTLKRGLDQRNERFTISVEA